MLCHNCRLHFDLAWQDYTLTKEKTISELHKLGADASLLEALGADLSRHCDARQRFQSHTQTDICPWVSPDLFSPKFPEDIRKELASLKLPVWESSKSFKDFADKGCEMCSRIVETIQPLGFKSDVVDVESFLVLEPISLLLSNIKVLVEEANLEFEWVRFKLLNNEHGATQLQNIDVNTPNSSFCVEKLISWLSECVKMHRVCAEGSSDGWIPTRLINIQEMERSGRVRVVCREEVENEPFGSQTRYMTLSHVWGDNEFLALNASNMQQFRSGFSASLLPRTFRDAMAVTSGKGVRYLWTDSLCIVQDSEADWSSEAGLIDKVYLNSYCNIVSSLSTRPEKGLFWDRDPALAGPFTAQFSPCPHTTQFDVFLDLQYLITNKSPLYKRGWVLQESCLSPRTIHCSRFPAFECRDSFSCESYRTTGPEPDFRNKDWLSHTTKTIFARTSFEYQD